MTQRVSKTAQAARRRATSALSRLIADETERDLYTEAVDRYVAAVELGAELREEWSRLGEPLMAEGSMRQPIPHPLVKMIADADAAAAKYASAVGLDPSARTKRAPGRPKAAVSAPDRAATPPRLRRVQ